MKAMGSGKLKAEKIECDIENVVNYGAKLGVKLSRLIINKKKLLKWRDNGVKYCQFSDQQINNPSKIKGYVGRKSGIKVYVR
jgi:hypothetical protein